MWSDRSRTVNPSVLRIEGLKPVTDRQTRLVLVAFFVVLAACFALAPQHRYRRRPGQEAAVLFDYEDDASR